MFFIRILLIAIILAFLFYFVNTKILGNKTNVAKSTTIILLATIGIYVVLGLLSYIVNN